MAERAEGEPQGLSGERGQKGGQRLPSWASAYYHDVELQISGADPAQELAREAPDTLLLPEAVDQHCRHARCDPSPRDPISVPQHELATDLPDDEPHGREEGANEPDALDRVVRLAERSKRPHAKCACREYWLCPLVIPVLGVGWGVDPK